MPGAEQPLMPPASQPLTITPLLGSMNLTALGTAYKQNHAVSVLLQLAYFTWHQVLKVHPCCHELQDFLLF